VDELLPLVLRSPLRFLGGLDFKWRLALGLAMIVPLSACTVGPDYVRPVATTSPDFKEAKKGWKPAVPRDGHQ
jgi:hypothetical protein